MDISSFFKKNQNINNDSTHDSEVTTNDVSKEIFGEKNSEDDDALEKSLNDASICDLQVTISEEICPDRSPKRSVYDMESSTIDNNDAANKTKYSKNSNVGEEDTISEES